MDDTAAQFLKPVIVLILWTFVMWAIMYFRRIPAMNAITKNTQKFIEEPDLMNQLPPRARWAADNYNHLHEQPVIFYALMFFLFLTGAATGLMGALAWAYVAVRILHSLVQISMNKVLVRFGLFVVASVILFIMAVYGAWHLRV